jgi:hypothetical protein
MKPFVTVSCDPKRNDVRPHELYPWNCCKSYWKEQDDNPAFYLGRRAVWNGIPS